MIKKILYIGFLLLLVELVSRVFVMGMLRANPSHMIYKYYPELKKIEKIPREKDSYDILFLGASTIASTFNNNGGVEKILLEQLKGKTSSKVRILNLSTPAHSSLDDLYKYKYLIHRKFDLVLFYDAINEVRANNCPGTIFKDDYSHYVWYEELKLLDIHQEIKYITFPYVFHELGLRIWKRLNHIDYVPRVWPKSEWIQYGADIKTRETYRNNIEEIIKIANQKQERVLLMSFAYYVPKDYTFSKFKNKQLDYGYLEYSAPIEEWGSPANVVKGIQVHNEVIKVIIKKHPEVLFIDQEKMIPKSGIYFKDICHFTPKGNKKFVENIWQTIEREIRHRFVR